MHRRPFTHLCAVYTVTVDHSRVCVVSRRLSRRQRLLDRPAYTLYTATMPMPGDRGRRVGLEAVDAVAVYRRHSPHGFPFPNPSPSTSNHWNKQ